MHACTHTPESVRSSEDEASARYIHESSQVVVLRVSFIDVYRTSINQAALISSGVVFCSLLSRVQIALGLVIATIRRSNVCGGVPKTRSQTPKGRRVVESSSILRYHHGIAGRPAPSP